MSGLIHIVVLISCVLGIESFPPQDSSLGVVGGHAVNITEVPFMARLLNVNIISPGAVTIVHPRFVITAASCYYYFQRIEKFSKSYVTVGSDDAKRNGQPYDVKQGFLHPKFKNSIDIKDYDIAVLELEKPLEFNERVKAIRLAEKDIVIPEGAKFNTLGFGSVSKSDLFVFPDKLQQATVPYVSHDKCQLKNHHFDFTERMICAFGDGLGACNLDEGGPLIYNNTLLGVASYPECGSIAVYTYIPALRDFIDNIIGPS